MLTLGKKIIVTKDELRELMYKEYRTTRDALVEEVAADIKSAYAEEIERIEGDVKNRDRKIKDLNDDLEDRNRDISSLKKKVKVLEDDRDDVRELIQKEMELSDLDAVLEAKKDILDERTAKLKERENELGSKEAGEYKKGYADGVADGVRRISEVTQADRDNAMKIAMVAASSHTPVDNMKEVMNVSRQLTAGTSDSQA